MGILQVVNGDKEAVDAILDNDHNLGRGLCRLHPDRRNTSMSAAAPTANACSVSAAPRTT